MGFLPDNITDEFPDYKLFEELWELMEGTERDGVMQQNLAYVLKVIRGAYEPKREINEEAPEDKQGLARYIYIDDEENLQFRKDGQ